MQSYTIFWGSLLICFLPGIQVAYAQTADEMLTQRTTSLEAALDWARRTGSPIFVIAGRESCAACKVFKRQVQTDEATSHLLRDCVKVYLDCDSPDYQSWISRHGPKGEILPQWFLVRSDGIELINRSGSLSGDQLNETLNLQLKAAGKAVTATESRQIQNLAAQVADQLKRDQVVEAAQVVSASHSTLRIAVNCYASPANELRQHLNELKRHLLDELELIRSAIAQLASIDQSQRAAKIFEIRARLERFQGISSIEEPVRSLALELEAQAQAF